MPIHQYPTLQIFAKVVLLSNFPNVDFPALKFHKRTLLCGIVSGYLILPMAGFGKCF